MSKLISSFEGVLNSIVDGQDYKQSPPFGPPKKLPSLTNDELKALQMTPFGEDLRSKNYSYSHIALIEEPHPREVEFPSIEDLKRLNVCGIDGSNQRVERSTFYFLLTRAAIVEFRYSSENERPYFYNKLLDSSAVLWVDGNIFDNSISLHSTYLPIDKDENANCLDKLNSDNKYPFLLKHDPGKIDKSPNNHALGWAVKLQQALELKCLEYIPTDIETICIKDGPLFSTSISPTDTINGLSPIYQWKDQVLIACSKRVKDSSLLLEALQQITPLRDYWFPEQNITDETLKSVSTDSILLPRILHPGFRTPLMEAIPRARSRVVDPKKGGQSALTPLSCYYLSKHQPHTYLRIEVPRLHWERNPKGVYKAISVVAWQHELGHRAPLVQLASDMRCQLSYEKNILEKQTISRLHKNKLDLPEDY